jgi:hypothetical protein
VDSVEILLAAVFPAAVEDLAAVGLRVTGNSFHRRQGGRLRT